MERLTTLSLEVQGEQVELRGDRSMFWPRQSMLVVADLHVGKTESLRHRGMTLPGGVLEDDLIRLSAALAETGARRLVVIGDLVHDRAGLTRHVRETVARWRDAHDVAVELIPGNHDARIDAWPSEWGLTVHEERLTIHPFDLIHDPTDANADAVERGARSSSRGSFTWGGHVHPVVVLERGADRLRLPCFVVESDYALLPAFSWLTGGHPIPPRSTRRVFAVVDGRVVAIPARR